MEIKHIQNANGGEFIAFENDIEAGKITYKKTDSHQIIVDHTFVHEPFQGIGLGKTILTDVIKYARENKIKIVPECSYVKKVFDKNEDLHDVL